MSEYWKSTPKYWCKHCKTYVRDTPFERTQHEATGKHQGSLKRFLRDVHRSQDKDQKDSQKAKNEIERLKGLVAPTTKASGQQPTWKRGTGHLDSGTSASLSVNKEQRKRQMEQLAEMGVAIPEEFRPEMALAGEWKTVSETLVTDSTGRDTAAMVKGVRKRKLDGQEEGEEGEEDETSDERVEKEAHADFPATEPHHGGVAVLNIEENNIKREAPNEDGPGASTIAEAGSRGRPHISDHFQEAKAQAEQEINTALDETHLQAYYDDRSLYPEPEHWLNDGIKRLSLDRSTDGYSFLGVEGKPW
ncbi:hypothetical protein CIHG_05973 [Coccidioides immitis H538.4]|uniref:U1-type domain-containing protein n=1 Tax=Coccidioides immitis H538.4 TaxID=396776 RepID=A0A0J8RR18_COCIT|nr:hypothetical protein CIHG_05973 [Coccidioides immitis H538.4]